MHKKAYGFTIIELLVVIVVIAILAAVSIVAYSGIQQRAKNSQTHSAVAAWVKGLNLYRQANGGSWPPDSSWTCLGEGYKWGPGEVETAAAFPNNTQCASNASSTVNISKASFDNAMREYVGGSLPTPAMVTTYNNAGTSWYRGAFFTTTGGSGTAVSIRVVYAGDISCPSVPMTTNTVRALYSGNAYCTYNMGERGDPI